MEKNEPIRIIFMSNSPTFITGYAKVIKEISQRLSNDSQFQIWVVGEQYSGMPMKYGTFTLMARRDGGNDLVNAYLEQIKPHYFVWLEDTFTMTRGGVDSFKFPPITKFVVYIPQDGEFIPTTGHNALKRADIIIPMAQFSKEVTEREGFKCTDAIYHGVDFKLFTPAIDARDKIEARKHLGLKEEDFIVLYVGRNSARKLNQELLETFARFAIDKDDVKLVAHVNGFTAAENHLPDFIARCLPIRHGSKFKDLLGKKILFNPRAQSLQMGATEKEMAVLYRAADIYFSAASGEGFGMPLTEAMSTQIPVAAVDFTTTKELIIDERDGIKARGLGIKPITKWTGSFNVAHAIIDQEDGIRVLNELYENPELRKEMGLNGRKFVLKYCDWDILVDQWKQIFIENRSKFNKEYIENQKKNKK